MFTTISQKTSFYTKEIKTIIDSFNLLNPFNPSIYINEHTYYISVRAFGESMRLPFESFLIIYNRTTTSSSILNLTTCMSKFGIAPTADPRFFIYKNEVWISFNTGYKFYENNDIYVVPIHKIQECKPWKCMLNGRRNTEKNWALFSDSNNQLCAIYSLSPLQIIEEERRDDIHHLIFFRKRTLDAKYLLPKRMRFTIGTQLVKRGGDFYLIAHEKIFLITKLIYFGRLVKLEKRDNGFIIKAISKKRLIHSYLSVFGRFKKHNKSLISCTYFSGLCAVDDSLLVSYGINDLNYNIADIASLL